MVIYNDSTNSKFLNPVFKRKSSFYVTEKDLKDFLNENNNVMLSAGRSFDPKVRLRSIGANSFFASCLGELTKMRDSLTGKVSYFFEIAKGLSFSEMKIMENFYSFVCA